MHVPPKEPEPGTPILLVLFLLVLMAASGVALVWLNATAAYPYGLR